MVEESLCDLVEKGTLPTLVRITRQCILKHKEVLKEGQLLTILSKKTINLVFGKDSYGKEFRINAENGQKILVETIEDFYPKTTEDILRLITSGASIQLNNKFGISNLICEAGECFIYSSESEHIDSITGEMLVSFIREKDDSIVEFPINSLTNTEVFTFVIVKSRINLQSLIRSFTPQKVRFVNIVSDRTPLPVGISTLDAIWKYEIILTATLIDPSTAMYEMFQLDRRILVEKCDDAFIPQFIQNLGGKESESYNNKLTEVEFAMYYDIYAARFYGSLHTKEPLTSSDLTVICDNIISPVKHAPAIDSVPRAKSFDAPNSSSQYEDLKFRPRSITDTPNKKSVFNSLRKAIHGVKRNSPTSETIPENVQPVPLTENDNTSIFQRHDTNLTPAVVKNARTPEEQDQETIRNSEKASENPLYGYDALKQLRLQGLSLWQEDKSKTNASLENIKSKPLSPDDMTRKRTTSVVEIASFSSPRANVDSLYLSRSTDQFQSPHGPHPNVRDTSRPIPIQRPDRFIRPLHHSRSLGLDENIQIRDGLDSGIEDSPDTRKSIESIYANIFALQEEGTLTKDDLKQGSKKPTPAPRKDSQLYAMLQRERSQSDSCIDVPNSLEYENEHRAHSTPLDDDNSFYDTLDYSVVQSITTYRDIKQKQEVESLNEIRDMTVDDVITLLAKLRLFEHKEKFKENMINGKLLYKIEESAFYRELGLSKFEARKLYRYVHGWRPNNQDLSSDDLKFANFTLWSVRNVQDELKSIQLRDFAEFCYRYEIDGSLLEELLEDELIESLRISHNIELSSIDVLKFRSYITKELIYEDHEKIKKSFKDSPLK